MGHFCWMCRRNRPNEAFSGGNHGRHLCRECARLPQETRDRASRLENLWSMLVRQRVISPKNIGMAYEWACSEDAEVVALARIVMEVGRVHPARKKRLPHIRSRHPELWARMVDAGVVDDWLMDSSWEPEPAGLNVPCAVPDESVDENVDLVSPAREEYDEDEIPF